MMLNEITATVGGHRRRKRVGRGESSGHGKTCGRGNKGFQSRAGGGARRLTEGGQMPLFRRLPKRGFNNYEFRDEYQVLNVGLLNERFDQGARVDLESLRKLNLVQGPRPLVRILGHGQLEKKLTVQAHAFSGKARAAIEQAGGTVQVIERPDRAAQARAKRNSARKSAAKAGGDKTPPASE
jgi:large subunit ribosomal protein L15